MYKLLLQVCCYITGTMLDFEQNVISLESEIAVPTTYLEFSRPLVLFAPVVFKHKEVVLFINNMEITHVLFKFIRFWFI